MSIIFFYLFGLVCPAYSDSILTPESVQADLSEQQSDATELWIVAPRRYDGYDTLPKQIFHSSTGDDPEQLLLAQPLASKPGARDAMKHETSKPGTSNPRMPAAQKPVPKKPVSKSKK